MKREGKLGRDRRRERTGKGIEKRKKEMENRKRLEGKSKNIREETKRHLGASKRVG